MRRARRQRARTTPPIICQSWGSPAARSPRAFAVNTCARHLAATRGGEPASNGDGKSHSRSKCAKLPFARDAQTHGGNRWRARRGRADCAHCRGRNGHSRRPEVPEAPASRGKAFARIHRGTNLIGACGKQALLYQQFGGGL